MIEIQLMHKRQQYRSIKDKQEIKEIKILKTADASRCEKDQQQLLKSNTSWQLKFYTV